MDTRMILDFMQNQQPIGLAQIGQLAGQKIAQRRDRKQWEAMEGQWDEALETVISSSEEDLEENIARFYDVALHMGRFDEARDAVNDYFERQQYNAEAALDAQGAAVEDIPIENPNMTAYMSILDAWMNDKLNTDLQNRLIVASQAEGVDKYTEAQELVSGANERRDTAADEAAANASLENYDRSGSSDDRLEVLKAFSRLGSEYAGVAMQALDSIEANWSEADKARILRDQTDVLFAAQDAFTKSGTMEDYLLMLQAGQPLDEWQNMVEYANGLEDDEIERNIENAISILAPLSGGRIDDATEAVSRLMEAFKDDPDELAGLQEVQNQLDEGDAEGAREYLYTLMGTTQQGRDAVEHLLTLNADRRADQITASRLVEAAYKLEFDTEEQRADFERAAEELNDPTVQALVEFGRVAQLSPAEGSAAWDTLLDREESLRKEYEKDTSSYTTIAQNVANLEALYDLDDPTGMTDQAFITLFNKVLDPESVVRESEAARTAAAQAFIDQIEAAIKGLETGVSLTKTSRAAIVESARELGRVSEEYRTSYRDRIQNTIDVIDEDGTLGSAERIFRDTVPAAERALEFRTAVDTLVTDVSKRYNLTEEDIRSAIRTEGVTNLEELKAWAANTDHAETLQRDATISPVTTDEDGTEWEDYD